MSNESFDLYLKMYLIRRAEERIIKHYPEDEMKTPMHMSMGQEAVAVAVCHALGDDGQIFGFYRSHALFLAKTGDSDGFFGELFGKVLGPSHGKAGSMHLASPERGLIATSAVVSTNIPLALGAAFANKQQGLDRIACAYFGDGALDEGVFWESINSASVMKLPVLFVCEDNGLAVHSGPEVRQGYRSITGVVDAFDCNVYREESTDVEILHNKTVEAIQAIMTTGKPSFLHIKSYRYLGHIGIYEDFDARYRTKDEYEQWFERDPIALQRTKLLESGWTEGNISSEEACVDERLAASVDKARAAAFPNPEELYTGVFSEAR